MFGRLEELDIIQFTHPSVSRLDGEFELNLPMLASIQLEQVKGIEQLTGCPEIEESQTTGVFYL